MAKRKGQRLYATQSILSGRERYVTGVYGRGHHLLTGGRTEISSGPQAHAWFTECGGSIARYIIL